MSFPCSKGYHLANLGRMSETGALAGFVALKNIKMIYVGVKMSYYSKRRMYERIFSIKFKRESSMFLCCETCCISFYSISDNRCVVLRRRGKHWRFGSKKCDYELPLVVEYKECKKNEFRCADGRECINSKLTCNGVKECDDGSDEELPKCSKLESHV